MSGAWVAALDGGGTKTALALASRAGEVLVLPQGAGCNPQDGPGWDEVLSDLLGRAARAEGGLAAAALGIPGRGEVPAHDAAVDALLARLLPMPFEAMNDVALAHLGAFGGGEGVLLLAGTGSMAWARGPTGEARVGGWGDAFGDEGSAHWIGREALSLASRAMDGRDLASPGFDPPAFARALCERLGPEAAGPFGPLTWLMDQGGGRAAVAGVARHMDALADEGHEVARKLLHAAAVQLAALARAAAERVGLPSVKPWVPAGGTFGSARLRRYVEASLRAAPSLPRLSTLGGGLFRAATLAAWEPDRAWAARVDARLRTFAPAPRP
jgi:N-acetylglucosamine kinase-like BadF-type ATPase